MSYFTNSRKAVLMLIVGLAVSADSRCQNCSYHMIAFPQPVSESFIPQVGLNFSSRLIEGYVPQWLQDSVASFLPHWVESSREISDPVAEPNFRYQESAIWLHRVIRFDTASPCVLLDLRHTGVMWTQSWDNDQNRVASPLYIVANQNSQGFYPIVHGMEVGLTALFNGAVDNCGDAIPRDLLCRTKFVLALEYEDQSFEVIESPEELAQAYMLFREGRNLGYITRDELFLSRPLPDLDDPFYREKDVKYVQKEIREIPKEYTRLIKPVEIIRTSDVDSVRLWVYAYDCGEVAEWVVTYDKMRRLLGLEYAREPERTVSGGLTVGSPYDRIRTERSKTMGK